MESVFLRHASRASPFAQPPALAEGYLGDGGLSDRGRSEAEALAFQIESKQLLRPTLLLASPKRRTQDTLAIVASALSISTTVVQELDERRSGESALHFDSRVRGFVEELASAFGPNDVAWICSHLDWLERAMLFLPSNLSELEIERPFECAEARVFSWNQDLWQHQKSLRSRP